MKSVIDKLYLLPLVIELEYEFLKKSISRACLAGVDSWNETIYGPILISETLSAADPTVTACSEFDILSEGYTVRFFIAVTAWNKALTDQIYKKHIEY